MSQSAFHRIDPDLATRAGWSGSLFTRTDSPSHPVARREPGPPSSMGGWSPRAIPPPPARESPRVTPRRLARRAMTRKMRLTDFCNRPTIRAPHGLPDSQVRARRAPRPLRAPQLDDSRERALGQWPPAHPRVKLRLTANLQLRPCRNPSTVARARVAPVAAPAWCRDASRSWRSFDRMLLRAAPPDRGVVNREPSLRRSL